MASRDAWDGAAQPRGDAADPGPLAARKTALSLLSHWRGGPKAASVAAE